MSHRTLRVAAVQTRSRPGCVADNLAHAAAFVARASERGARIVLLPELMPGGFAMTEAQWAVAEPAEGPTVRWLRTQAQRHGVWIGTSFVEARGGDAFNTFALASDRGEIVARVRKSRPASVEAFFFRGASDARVVDTPFGRVGVAICYENMLAAVRAELHAGGADLVLMPHCAPTPNTAGGFGPREVEALHASFGNVGRAVAAELGVPSVMANQSGPWVTPMPLFPAADSTFPGLSAITDSDGTVRGQLGAEEDLLVADVTLAPERKTAQLPPARGRWARPLPWFVNVWAASEALGSASYALRSGRRRRALADAVAR